MTRWDCWDCGASDLSTAEARDHIRQTPHAVVIDDV